MFELADPTEGRPPASHGQQRIGNQVRFRPVIFAMSKGRASDIEIAERDPFRPISVRVRFKHLLEHELGHSIG